MFGGSQNQRGSALFLVPTGLLVLMILASISVDSAIAYMGRQQLQDSVESAANDAVTLAIPDGVANVGLQTGNEAELDLGKAQQVVNNQVLRSYSSGLSVDSVDVQTDGQQVTIVAVAHVNYVFAKAIPGARDSAVVKVRSIAQVRFR